jgi:hypothetical protein
MPMKMMSLSQVVGQDQDERTDQRQGHNTYKDRRHEGGNGALSMQVRLLNVYTNVIWRGSDIGCCVTKLNFSQKYSSPVVISIMPD